MKSFLKYAFTGALAIFLASCEDDEQNVTDLVQETVERGAVLRTIDFTDELVLDVSPEQFVITLEEQDVEEGGLLQEVNVYVTYADNSEIAGNSESLNTSEVLIDNVPAAEWSPGPFGLPRVTLTYSVDEMLAAVGGSSTDQIYLGDTFTFREELILTDGRIFSVDNAGGIITAGFFNSPFQHIQTVTGGLNLSFRENGTNEINIAPGQPNEGYSTILQIQEVQQDFWDQVEVFVSLEDNFDEDDTDLSTAEVSLGVIPRADFTEAALDEENEDEPIDMAVGAVVEFSLDDLLTGIDPVTIDQLNIGDNINIRYSVRNAAGREISSLEEPFTIPVPVVSCPVLPLADNETFVGEYQLTQGTATLFGYTTWGEGTVVMQSSLDAPVDILTGDPISLGDDERAFDANYLDDLGPGNTPLQSYIAVFKCQSVTLKEDSAPIGNFTGWQCSGPSIYGAPDPAGGGPFNVDDDTMFTIAFAEDVEGSCGDPLTNVPTIQFDKL